MTLRRSRLPLSNPSKIRDQKLIHQESLRLLGREGLQREETIALQTFRLTIPEYETRRKGRNVLR